MHPPSILTITQNDMEGCVMTFSYAGISDEQAIAHFLSELRNDFRPRILGLFRAQLKDMLARSREAGFLSYRDPSVQGYLTVSWGLLYTPETLPDPEPEKQRYSVRVSETRDYTRTYTVEASSEEEAVELAEKGETVDESEGTLTEICGREVISTPELLS